jgi:lysophospholipase L1-like esterase
VVTWGTSLSALYRWQPDVMHRMALAGVETRLYSPPFNGPPSDVALANVARVVAMRPKAVLMEFSMNDCPSFPVSTARSNTIAILDALKAVVPANRIYLMTMNRPVGSGSDAVARVNVPYYYENYRALAASEGVGLIDLEPLWVSGYVAGDIPDGLHPTEAAVKRIACPAVADRLIADLA